MKRNNMKRFINFINPFNEVIEDTVFINSRAKRTGFWQKTADTYFVFAGSFFDRRGNHLGIFDYMTLGIPYGLGHIFFYTLNNIRDPIEGPILALTLGAINLPFVALRYSFAAIATAISLPFIILAHGLSRITGKRSQDHVNALEITVEPNRKDLKSLSTINDFLRKKRYKLEDVTADLEGKQGKFRVDFHQAVVGPSASLVCECCKTGGDDSHRKHTIFSAKFNFIKKPGDREKFQSLLQLNIGRITRKLRKRGYDIGIFSESTATTKDHANIVSTSDITTYGHKKRSYF